MTSLLRRNPLSNGILTKPQYLSIQKAITDKDSPPKTKHVRAIILTTFEEHSSAFFYTYISERSISLCPVVCWKFLYVVYKLLRCGHPECVKDGIRNASKLWQLQSSWSQSSSPVSSGYLLTEFFNFIMKRLKLHRKYAILPGSLELSAHAISAALQALPDHLFQFSVDLMDFLEELLRFCNIVLNAVHGWRGIVCTSSTQCRMIPLLLCLQDGAAVYDLVAHILFKLHEELDHNAMGGHRERFITLHSQLRNFFQKASSIQYFKAFVQIPALSQDPPNFTIQSERDRHTSIRISIEESPSSDEEPPDRNPVGFIFDGSNATLSNAPSDLSNQFRGDELENFTNFFEALPQSSTHSETTQKVQSGIPNFPNQMEPGLHRESKPSDDEFLLETELLKSELMNLKDEHKQIVESLVERINTLESEIQNVVQQKSRQDELESDLRAYADRATTSEEKFSKLKQAYSKLREEHVNTLQNLTNARSAISEFEQQNNLLKKQIQNVEMKLKNTEKSQLSSSKSVRENGDIISNIEKSTQWVEQTSKPLVQTSSQHQTSSEAKWLYVSDVTSDEETDLSACFQEAIRSPQTQLLSRICARAVDGIHELSTTTADHTSTEISTDFIDASQFILKRATDTITQLKVILQGSCTTTDGELLFNVFDVASSLLLVFSQLRNLSVVISNKESLPPTDELAKMCIQLFQTLTMDRSSALQHASSIASSIQQLDSSLGQLQLSTELSKQAEYSEWISLVNKEMFETEKTITDAEHKFKELTVAPKTSQVRVHKKILDHCSALIAAVKILVLKSKAIQLLISDFSLNSETYKHQGFWAQGFLSAAKSVGACANVLVEVADQFVSGREHVFERLLVVAQEVSASTTHLFVASRVKLPSDSPQLIDLQAAVRAVSQATGDLVGSVKSAIETRESRELDFSGLTLTQTKRLQVESQVRVLTLEKALDDERYQLSQLRKHNYQNEAEVDDQILDE